MMRMFIAATALAGLIGVPTLAEAGCGCSGGAQAPIASAAPISPYYAGGYYYTGGYQAVPSTYQTFQANVGSPVYAAAPVNSRVPNRIPAPYSTTPRNLQPMTPSQFSTVQQYSATQSRATTPLAVDTPSCCANGGSSCCSDGGSSCCQSQAGGAPTTPPTSLPTTLRLSTSGDSTPQLDNAPTLDSQAPPMPPSMSRSAPATQSPPAAVDPHAGHRH